MARASIEDFEVDISPTLLLPYTLEQSKWPRGIGGILLNEEIGEPFYVRAERDHKKGASEERRLNSDITARC
jgi:hypothetical protein